MNTLKRTAAWTRCLVLMLAALLLSRAALAALRLGEMFRDGSETAEHRAIALGPSDGAWCALSAAILHELARTSLACTVRWSGRSQRLYVLVNQARI